MSVYEGVNKLTEYEVSKDPAPGNEWQDPKTLYCSDRRSINLRGNLSVTATFLKTAMRNIDQKKAP